MANYNSAYTGAQIDEAIGKVISKESTWDGKQDALGFTPVPNTRKVNGKALSSDITLDAADIGAVPTTRKVNNKALSQDITLSASDVGAIPASQKGTANGVAELDANGKVPSSQLPSYVDDVLEYDKLSSFPSTGETGKIYIARDTNLCYRWSGSGYVEISPSLALGETATTAYRGDRGKIAYDHSQTTGNPHSTTPADIGAAASGHTHSDYMPKSGGTFTGIATAQSNTSYTTRQIRNFVLSTSDPSGGSNGDVWIKYT